MRGEITPEPDGLGGHRGIGGRDGLDVYLVRHAVAHRRDPAAWPDDRLRPLTRGGEEAFRTAARTLGGLESGVGAVFSSPLTRAWQTAGILESEGPWPAPRELPELAPETPAADMFSALTAAIARGELPRTGAVALVGHRPSLHELAAYMVSGDPRGLEVKIK